MRGKAPASSLLHLGGIAVLLVMVTLCAARAHVTLTENNAAPGAHFIAHFRVGHGCTGSPTIALTVAIPPGVEQVAPVAPPGWSVAVVREGTRTTAVTWKGGELAPDKPGEFVVAMTLPQGPSPLAFPATQICKSGQEHWDQMPSGGTALKNPAPLLVLGAVPEASGLEVSEGWFRALPAGLPAGAYFSLRNSGARPVVLTGAASPGCGTLMLHKSDSSSGMASMQMVGSVAVPAGGSISFSPGSYHLMCMNPGPAITPGASVPVTLQFQDGAKLTTAFAVRNAAGK